MMRRLRAYLVTPQAGTLIPCLVIALPLLSSASRMFFGGLAPSAEGPRQISGYYLDGLLFGLLLLLLIAWIISIVSLIARKDIRRGIARLLAIPVVGFVSAMVWVGISSALLRTDVCGWPARTVYSPRRDKYYMVVAEPPADPGVTYHIFSVEGSRLAPIWQREFSDIGLCWPGDEPERGGPHLTLSGNEQLLVVGRGEQLIYAIAIDERGDRKHYPVRGQTHDTVFSQGSDDSIRALLAANAEKGAPLVLTPPVVTPPAPVPGSKLDIQAGTPVAYDRDGVTVAIEGPLADEIIAALNTEPIHAEKGVYMDVYPQTRVRIGERVFQVIDTGLILFDEWGRRVWFLDGIDTKLDAAAD